MKFNANIVNGRNWLTHHALAGARTNGRPNGPQHRVVCAHARGRPKGTRRHLGAETCATVAGSNQRFISF